MFAKTMAAVKLNNDFRSVSLAPISMTAHTAIVDSWEKRTQQDWLLMATIRAFQLCSVVKNLENQDNRPKVSARKTTSLLRRIIILSPFSA